MTKRGLTLMETIVTVAVTGIIVLVVTQAVLSFYKANRVALEESFQIRSAERGVQVLVRDLREATYGDNGAYPLNTIGTSTISFYSDIDHSAPIERIDYVLSGNRLTRSVTYSTGNPPQYTGTTTTSVVSDFVRNIEDGISMFRYFDASGAEVTDPLDIADIVSVTVSLVVDITPVHAPGEFTLRSSASLRNLRPQ